MTGLARQSGQIHIVGAGLAGLAAAVRLVERGRRVSIYEAAPQAGGRCRSYHDSQLDRLIDNGNHLMLAANPAVLELLETVGARDRVTGPPDARFPFVDITTGRRWTLRPNAGPIPWWLFHRDRRPPGVGAGIGWTGLRMALAGRDKTIAPYVGEGPERTLFWEPLVLAVMNASPEEAAAHPMARVLRETFAKGGQACRPLVAVDGLAPALIDPIVAWLGARGVQPATGRRLRAIERGTDGHVDGLRIDGDRIDLSPDDRVILAVPPAVAKSLLPDLAVPEGDAPIVNLHFRLDKSVGLPDPAVPFVGLIGTDAQWVFARGDVASVTVSAADHWVDRPADAIVEALWPDVARGLGLPSSPVPAWRVVKEKRATFRQTPANLARRPKPSALGGNLVLAGDWTDTGLPATLEGAARSGLAATRLV